jgi:hypothetical protein
MKKYILCLILLGFVVTTTSAQDSDEKDTPVSSTFASGYLIDNQTVVVADARTLEFAIQHKFGTFGNGFSDLFGIYAPGSNIRLGLDYVPVKNLQIGIGITKKNMYTDFSAKWAILTQTEKNTIPVSLALYGVAAIDGRGASSFGSGQVVDTKGETLPSDITFSDKFSYFSQLIVARKFTNWLSLQVGASFTHYNMVEPDWDHDRVGFHFNGRLKFSEQSSFIFNYDLPLKIKSISEQPEWIDDDHSLPNLSLGIEIATYTHAFQIYVGTADGIIPQDMMMYNQNDWKNKGIAIGFVITRLWMF